MAGLNVACNDCWDVTFIDISASFLLGDASINDGYLQLTRGEVNKLAQKLEFRTKNPGEGVALDHKHSRTGQTGTPRPRWMPRHDQRPWIQQARCYYCYETGHIAEKCRHGGKVECYSCKRLGYKAKFCRLVYVPGDGGKADSLHRGVCETTNTKSLRQRILMNVTL